MWRLGFEPGRRGLLLLWHLLPLGFGGTGLLRGGPRAPAVTSLSAGRTDRGRAHVKHATCSPHSETDWEVGWLPSWHPVSPDLSHRGPEQRAAVI